MEKILQPERPQTTLWRMRFACWIPEVKHILLLLFPLQQWLNERVSILRYKYIYFLYFKGLSYQMKLSYEG